MAPRNTLHDPTTYCFLLPSKIEKSKVPGNATKKKQTSQTVVAELNNVL